jgi:hypothetical protein
MFFAQLLQRQLESNAMGESGSDMAIFIHGK